MLSRFELVSIGVSVLLMALALYLVRIETAALSLPWGAQMAAVPQAGVVIVGGGGDINQQRTEAYLAAADERGNITRMVIEDIVVGAGEAVAVGDTVTVHYIGRLPNGQEFDNSNKRGEPFTFTVGGGTVIEGWEKGLVGMKAGGKRVLVIPPALAYGARAVGSIPPDSTLIFAIELLSVRR
jgi:hypothetical protein